MTALDQRGEAILRRLPDEARAVEVGTAQGRLAEWLLTRRAALELVVVDNWEVPSRQPERYRATGDVNTLISDEQAAARPQLVRGKMNRFGERAKVMEMDSLEAAVLFEDESQDLIFIDADHSFEAVAADLMAWWPKVKIEGWLGGHDYANPDPRFRFGVTEAVDAFVRTRGLALELDNNFTWWIRRLW